MDLINNITLNTYSILLLIVIHLYSIKHKKDKSISSKLYLILVQLTIFMLIMDSLSRLDGKVESFYPILNHLGNFTIFLLSPILPSLWLIFVHTEIFDNINGAKKLILPLVSLTIINAILVALNLHFGWFYTITSQNIYVRGPLFLYSAMPTFIIISLSTLMVLFNRSKIDDRHYFSFLFFIVPPAISIFLQICIYGSSLILNGIVFSLLIVFLNIQNKSIFTDHLTGIYNRKMLDKYLANKINKSTKEKTFSAIMLDLNDFKRINDTYGHDKGDEAIINTVRILKRSLKPNDLIARFGGDEFWLVLNISTDQKLLEIVNDINKNFAEFNKLEADIYELGLSMGYSVYNYNSNMQVFEFQKYLDDLMYLDKSIGN